MFTNPIIQRYRFSQFRPNQFWIFGTLYVCILLLMFFINASLYSVGEAFYSPTELFNALFIQISIVQVVLLWLMMPLNCSNVVPREIADKSFDFFRMLPLSATTKTLGILIGRNLFNILISTVNLCIWLGLGLLAQVDPALLLQWLILFIAGTLLLNTLSLLSSILSFNTKKPPSVPMLVLVAIFAFGPIVGSLVETAEEGKLVDLTVRFFTFEIPLLYLIALYVAIAAAWSFIGIRRRFAREYEPLFSRFGAMAFMVCYLALLYALYHSPLVEASGLEFDILFYSFYFVAAIPLLIIALLSIRTFDKYVEITRSAARGNVLFKLLCSSNLFLGIVLGILWALAAGMVSGITYHTADFYKLTMLLFSAWLIILALIEIYAVYLPNNEKIAYLLVFLGGLYLILPMVISGIFDHKYIAMFSPLGVIYTYEMYDGMVEILAPFIFNLMLLLPMLLLILSRHKRIAQLRGYIEADAHQPSA